MMMVMMMMARRHSECRRPISIQQKQKKSLIPTWCTSCLFICFILMTVVMTPSRLNQWEKRCMKTLKEQNRPVWMFVCTRRRRSSGQRSNTATHSGVVGILQTLKELLIRIFHFSKQTINRSIDCINTPRGVCFIFWIIPVKVFHCFHSLRVSAASLPASPFSLKLYTAEGFYCEAATGNESCHRRQSCCFNFSYTLCFISWDSREQTGSERRGRCCSLVFRIPNISHRLINQQVSDVLTAESELKHHTGHFLWSLPVPQNRAVIGWHLKVAPQVFTHRLTSSTRFQTDPVCQNVRLLNQTSFFTAQSLICDRIINVMRQEAEINSDYNKHKWRS